MIVQRMGERDDPGFSYVADVSSDRRGLVPTACLADCESPRQAPRAAPRAAPPKPGFFARNLLKPSKKIYKNPLARRAA